tara:strand:+ start:557 stop:661 length:105 start_codon:yes stop_codon:yes gene_type:complete
MLELLTSLVVVEDLEEDALLVVVEVEVLHVVSSL